MFCESCGARIPDGSTFCEECGARISPAGGTGDSEPKIIPRAPEPSAPSTPPPPPTPQVQSAPTPPASNVNYQPQQASAPNPSSEGSGLSGNTKNIIMAAAGVLAVVIIVVAGLYAKKSGLIGAKGGKTDNQGTEVSADVMPENTEQQVAETSVTAETAAETQTQAADENGGDTTAQTTADQTTADQTGADSDGDYSQTSSGSLVPSITGPEQDVVIQDFDWFYNEGFPEDGTAYTELWGLGGKWKSLL